MRRAQQCCTWLMSFQVDWLQEHVNVLGVFICAANVYNKRKMTQLFTKPGQSTWKDMSQVQLMYIVCSNVVCSNVVAQMLQHNVVKSQNVIVSITQAAAVITDAYTIVEDNWDSNFTSSNRHHLLTVKLKHAKSLNGSIIEEHFAKHSMDLYRYNGKRRLLDCQHV